MRGQEVNYWRLQDQPIKEAHTAQPMLDSMSWEIYLTSRVPITTKLLPTGRNGYGCASLSIDWPPDTSPTGLEAFRMSTSSLNHDDGLKKVLTRFDGDHDAVQPRGSSRGIASDLPAHFSTAHSSVVGQGIARAAELLGHETRLIQP